MTSSEFGRQTVQYPVLLLLTDCRRCGRERRPLARELVHTGTTNYRYFFPFASSCVLRSKQPPSLIPRSLSWVLVPAPSCGLTNPSVRPVLSGRSWQVNSTMSSSTLKSRKVCVEFWERTTNFQIVVLEGWSFQRSPSYSLVFDNQILRGTDLAWSVFNGIPSHQIFFFDARRHCGKRGFTGIFLPLSRFRSIPARMQYLRAAAWGPFGEVQILLPVVQDSGEKDSTI